MMFLAASEGNNLQWTPEQVERGYEEPWERISMGEHCSSTEFSSAAEIKSNCKSRAVRDRYSLLTSKQKQNLARRRKPPQSLQVVKNNKFATVD